MQNCCTGVTTGSQKNYVSSLIIVLEEDCTSEVNAKRDDHLVQVPLQLTKNLGNIIFTRILMYNRKSLVLTRRNITAFSFPTHDRIADTGSTKLSENLVMMSRMAVSFRCACCKLSMRHCHGQALLSGVLRPCLLDAPLDKPEVDAADLEDLQSLWR